jgi:hypothetical protein
LTQPLLALGAFLFGNDDLKSNIQVLRTRRASRKSESVRVRGAKKGFVDRTAFALVAAFSPNLNI